jgi:hypothetical protein
MFCRRADRRRARGNDMDAQRRHRLVRRGETEAIAERRVLALELSGRPGGLYREIARQLALTSTRWRTPWALT